MTHCQPEFPLFWRYFSMDNKTYFHVAEFRGSVTNALLNVPIAGVLDNILSKSVSGNFLAPDGSRIWGAVSGGVNALRARINTPAVRMVALPQIAPMGTGVTATNPQNLSVYGYTGPKPAPADEIAVEYTHSDIAPQIGWALMWMTFGRKQAQPGIVYRVRFTGAITGVVGSWASGALTFDQTLPSGIYEIQGMDAFGANLLGARLIFPGGGWRPGIIAHNTLSTVPREEFTEGDLGVFGQFDSVNVPQLEIYVEAANTVQEGFLDLVRIGDR
jgi:hypothetical protein